MSYIIRPYTYLLKCVPTNQYYYGVRWRNRVPAEQDFWINYFTSSNVVASLRKKYGNDAFEFEIRREFDNVDDAFKWEKTVLERMNVLQDDRWLNRNISGTKFRREGPISEITRNKMSIAKKQRIVTQETCEKIRNSKLGNIPWNKNKKGERKHSIESIEKIREASKNQVWTQDRRNKISSANKGKPSKLKGTVGKPLSADAKQKLSLSRKGRRFYNNGHINKISFRHPGNGWTEGRLSFDCSALMTKNSRKITIYNAVGDAIIRCNGDFEKKCKENDLPFQPLQKSYLNGGKPIFTLPGSLRYAKINNLLHLVGWFAKYD